MGTKDASVKSFMPIAMMVVIAVTLIVAIISLAIMKDDSQVALNKMYMPEYKYPVLQIYIPYQNKTDLEIRTLVDDRIDEWLDKNFIYKIEKHLLQYDYLDSQDNKTEYYLTKLRP